MAVEEPGLCLAEVESAESLCSLLGGCLLTPCNMFLKSAFSGHVTTHFTASLCMWHWSLSADIQSVALTSGSFPPLCLAPFPSPTMAKAYPMFNHWIWLSDIALKMAMCILKFLYLMLTGSFYTVFVPVPAGFHYFCNRLSFSTFLLWQMSSFSAGVPSYSHRESPRWSFFLKHILHAGMNLF